MRKNSRTHDHAFRQQLLAADGATRQSLVQEYIRQELARIMGIEPSSLETKASSYPAAVRWKPAGPGSKSTLAVKYPTV